MLAFFLFHHWWRCTFDWGVMGVSEYTVHLLMGQKRLKDEYKDPDMLHKVNKADMAGMMESIKEYLLSCHGVIRAPLTYIIRKTITVQVYGDYPQYVTPDNKIITMMLHLPPGKKKLHNKQSAQSVTENMAEYKIDNRSVYDILDKICKNTNLYPYLKHHKSKRNRRGAYYAIYSRWLSLNHVNVIASEAKMILQMSTYDGKKAISSWETL